MSNTTKGGTSLRLVTGLTVTALVVSGVIAANLHPRPLTPGCTLTARGGGSTIVAGDVAKLSCTDLTSTNLYKVYLTSGSLAGWSSAARPGGNGGGTSAKNAMGFNGASNTAAYLPGETYSFSPSGTTWTMYILVSSTTTVNALSVDDVTSTPVTIANNLNGLTINTAAYGFNPANVHAGTSLNLDFTGLAANENYKLRMHSGSSTTNLDTSVASGNGTSNPIQFGSSPLTSALIDSSSSTISLAVKTLTTTMSTNSNVEFDLYDDLGNLIQSTPGGTNPIGTITYP